MPTVNYIEADGRTLSVEVPLGENVMRGALYHDVDGMVGECGGGLSCATCHVYIDDQWTDRVGGPATSAEGELLENAAAEVLACSRLGCQIAMGPELDGLIVRLPEKQF